MAEIRRDEQKLWLILAQIRGVRVRLNSIAMQRWIFSTLALLVGSASLIFAAALMLGPLSFLSVGAVIVLFTLAAILREARAALRQRANPLKTATIADERGTLKGRLTTIMTLAQTPKLSPLWAYLVEDTYSLRDDFEPARIEPRFISRSIFTLLAACLVAALLVPYALVRRHGSRQTAAHGQPGQIIADIGNLEIRPADPALEPNAEVYADAETLRKLEDKLAAAQNQDNDKSELGRWMNKARNLAGDLQDQLTGEKSAKNPPLRLKLTDRNPSADRHGASNRSKQPGQDRDNSGKPMANSKGGGGNPAGNARRPQPPVTSLPGQQADQLAQNKAGLPQTAGPNSAHPGEGDLQSLFDNGSGSGGGSSHGSGSDPRNLFGQASSQPLGSDNFKITIEAQPSDESSTPGAPAYIPPRVRVPLNSNQYSDEPLARAAVPAADQMTIKRVFER